MDRHLSYLKTYTESYFLKVQQFLQSAFVIGMNSIKKSKYTNPLQIPVIINNRDTLYNLVVMIEILQQAGHSNIIILDNCSTYQPLLAYYETVNCRVIKLSENYGAYALWQSGVYKEFYKDYYVYSDSDILPIHSCPSDFVAHFKKILDNNPFTLKAGFSLKLNDLPDHFPFKKEVKYHEERFFKRKDPLFYDAPIDTTFALYKPYAVGGWKLKAARTVFPYEARHLPWYFDPQKLSEDNIHYIKNATAYTHWTQLMKQFVD